MKLTHKGRWEQGFAALCKFRRRKGHCCPPLRHVEGKYNLGAWVIVQRYRKDHLSVERKKRLDKIGFVWNARDFAWERGFAALLKIQATRRTLSRPWFTPRRKVQTWIVGCGAARKKERNVAQTQSAVKPDRF